MSSRDKTDASWLLLPWCKALVSKSDSGARIGSFCSNARGLGDRRPFFFPRRSDLAVNAEIKRKTPAKCSKVHTLLNKKNDKKSVVAFRAVLVILMVRAPKFLVMAAEHDDPKNPMLEKSTMTPTFPGTDQVRCSTGKLISGPYDPGCIMKIIPSRKSPLAAATTVMATSAMEYMRKINCKKEGLKQKRGVSGIVCRAFPASKTRHNYVLHLVPHRIDS